MGLCEVRELSVRAGVAGPAGLRRVDLTVGSGEVVGVFGSGASALVRTIAGALTPVAGVVRYDGEDVTRLPYGDLVTRGVVLVPAGWAPFGGATVATAVLAFTSFGGRGAAARAAWAATVLGWFPSLPPAAVAGALPPGGQRVLAVAATLARRPGLVLVDGLAGAGPAAHAAALAGLRAARAAGLSSIVADPARCADGAPAAPEGVDTAVFDRTFLVRGGLLRPWSPRSPDDDAY